LTKIGDPGSDKALGHASSRGGGGHSPPVDNDSLDGQATLRWAQRIGMRRGTFHTLRTPDKDRNSRLFSGF
jgi:hypothetical protein